MGVERLECLIGALRYTNYYRNTYALFLLDIFPWFFPDLSRCSATYFFSSTGFWMWLGPLRRYKNLLKFFGFIFQYLPAYLIVFLFFNFYCNIYVTDPIIDVCEVNNRRHYQCQSHVLAHTGIMRLRSIFEDINRLTIIWLTYLY